MTERNLDLQTAVEFICRCANDFGSTKALNKLRGLEINDNDLPDYLRGMNAALTYSAENEKRRMIMLARAISLSGLYLPMEAWKELGFPAREFILYADLSDGRIGDTLNQLSVLLHAQEELNLVLIVKSRLSSYQRVMLCQPGGFKTDLPTIELNGTIDAYIKDIGSKVKFNRELLQKCNEDAFNKLPKEDQYNDLDIRKSVVLHIRGGDALFEGALHLPPLSYYKKSILELNPKKIIIVSEPDHLQKYGTTNPLKDVLYKYCISKDIETTIVSTEDVYYDLGIIFWAKQVITSNSYFSKMMALYSRKCEHIYMPSFQNPMTNWYQDPSIKYIPCYDMFSIQKWQESIDYRFKWILES